MNKINVGILFGGRSAEHEVSLRSVQNIVEALDTSRYIPVLIGITKEGSWYHFEVLSLLNDTDPKTIALDISHGAPVYIDITHKSIPFKTQSGVTLDIDVIFPVLHGPYGEDGTVQGLCRLLDLPCVGAGVLGSAAGMDKDVMKRLLREAEVPVGDYMVIRKGEIISYNEVVNRLDLPLFVKPANMGSSVGVSKVTNEEEFTWALDEAFCFDVKVLIEKAIVGREVECAVLGNSKPKASTVGEIAPHHEFYSYDAKYIDENGASLMIPADITDNEKSRVKEMAIRVFQVLECSGLGRVDMFLLPTGQLMVNEINTLPGFTNASMYPKLWEVDGVSYSELISKLITLALEK